MGLSSLGARLKDCAEALFLLGVLVAPWPFGGAPDAARFVLCAALLLAWSLGLVADTLHRKGMAAICLPALAVPGLALAQAATRSSADIAATVDAALVAAAMVVALAFWNERCLHHSATRRLAGAILIACLAQAVFGAMQWQLGPDRVYGRASPIMTTPFGSYVNHNHFAGLIEMGAILALGWASGRWRRDHGPSPKSLGLAGVALALVAAHLASRSRGGLVALCGGLVIFVLLRLWATPARAAGSSATGPKWHRPAIAAAGIVLFLGFGLAVIPSQTRSHLATVSRGPADSSGAYRVDVARDTLRLAIDHPLLGSGLGAYADAFTRVKRGHGDVRTVHAESDVLEFLAEAGLAGVLVLAWLAWALGRGFADGIRHARDPVTKGIKLGAAAAAGALAIHSLIDFNLRLPANALVFASLIGLASASETSERRVGGRAMALAAALVALLLSGASAYRAAGAIGFQRAVDTRDPNQRLDALAKVVARHPYLAEAWRERGRLWWTLGVRGGSIVPPRLERAESDLEAAVALRPHWGEAWAELGVVRSLRADFAGARLALDRAQVEDPSHMSLVKARAELDTRDPAPRNP